MDLKIKLSSKRLNSGKCQVLFHVESRKGNAKWYGYTLAEPKDTLTEVVCRIKNKFSKADDGISLYQNVLYHLDEHKSEGIDLMIFKEA